MEIYILLWLAYIVGAYNWIYMHQEEVDKYPDWLQNWLFIFWIVPAISVWVSDHLDYPADDCPSNPPLLEMNYLLLAILALHPLTMLILR